MAAAKRTSQTLGLCSYPPPPKQQPEVTNVVISNMNFLEQSRNDLHISKSNFLLIDGKKGTIYLSRFNLIWSAMIITAQNSVGVVVQTLLIFLILVVFVDMWPPKKYNYLIDLYIIFKKIEIFYVPLRPIKKLGKGALT